MIENVEIRIKLQNIYKISESRFVIHFCITDTKTIQSKMLEEIRKDLIASFLLRKSALTDAQLDTILASETEGNLDSKRGLRETGMVSKGSFGRTLKQGEENIKSALYTLFLLSYIDLASPERLAQFVRTTRMLSQLKSVDPSKEDLLKVMEALEDFVEQFAGEKRKLIL